MAGNSGLEDKTDSYCYSAGVALEESLSLSGSRLLSACGVWKKEKVGL